MYFLVNFSICDIGKIQIYYYIIYVPRFPVMLIYHIITI